MAELRSLHLGVEPPQRSVIKELTEAYLAALAGWSGTVHPADRGMGRKKVLR